MLFKYTLFLLQRDVCSITNVISSKLFFDNSYVNKFCVNNSGCIKTCRHAMRTTMKKCTGLE